MVFKRQQPAADQILFDRDAKRIGPGRLFPGYRNNGQPLIRADPPFEPDPADLCDGNVLLAGTANHVKNQTELRDSRQDRFSREMSAKPRGIGRHLNLGPDLIRL